MSEGPSEIPPEILFPVTRLIKRPLSSAANSEERSAAVSASPWAVGEEGCQGSNTSRTHAAVPAEEEKYLDPSPRALSQPRERRAVELAAESKGCATRDGHEKVPEAAGDLQVSQTKEGACGQLRLGPPSAKQAVKPAGEGG